MAQFFFWVVINPYNSKKIVFVFLENIFCIFREYFLVPVLTLKLKKKLLTFTIFTGMTWNKALHVDYNEERPSYKIHAKIPNYEVNRACLSSQKVQSGFLGPLGVKYFFYKSFISFPTKIKSTLSFKMDISKKTPYLQKYYKGAIFGI